MKFYKFFTLPRKICYVFSTSCCIASIEVIFVHPRWVVSGVTVALTVTIFMHFYTIKLICEWLKIIYYTHNKRTNPQKISSYCYKKNYLFHASLERNESIQYRGTVSIEFFKVSNVIFLISAYTKPSCSGKDALQSQLFIKKKDVTDNS